MLASVLLIAYNYQRDKDAALNEAASQAVAVINSVDREFASIQSALYTLGTSRRLATGDMAGFHAQSVLAIRNIRAWNIVLTDPSGQQLVNTALPFGSPLPVDGTPARNKGLFEAGRPVVADLFYGKVARRNLFSVVVPITEESKVAYSLGAGVLPETAAALLQQQNLPAGWFAVVFDSTGTVVARTHQMEQFVGKKVSASLLRAVQAQSHGSLEGTTLEGVPVFTSFARSPVTGWGVALGIPRAGLTHNLWVNVAIACAIVALLLATGFAAAWHIGSRISESILALARPAFAIGHGIKADVPPLYFREANVLGEALSTASELLQQASAAVDRRDTRLSAILESAMDAIITVDADQRVILYNRAAADMFGWPPEEAVGRPLSQFVPARLREAHAHHVREFGRSDVTQRPMGGRGTLVTGLKRDGTEFPIEASISRFVEDGNTFFTAVMRDARQPAGA